VRADGHIVDADVCINAADNFFANIDPGFIATTGQFPFDLQNALTHEFGHLIGLGHSCWNLFSDAEQPIDDMGVPVPTCDTAPDDVVQTVMFATIQANLETSKRVLSPDDIRAACSIYPSAEDPHVCAYDMPNEGCGCRTSRKPGGHFTIALLSVLALLIGRRNRARARNEPRVSTTRSVRLRAFSGASAASLFRNGSRRAGKSPRAASSARSKCGPRDRA